MERALPYLAVPDGGRGAPVLVIHSWWGLTESFTCYADRLADAGFLAGCADLFDGRTATTAEEAKALRSARRREPMYRTLQHDIDSLRAHPASAAAYVALVGFPMGATGRSGSPSARICLSRRPSCTTGRVAATSQLRLRRWPKKSAP